jgi:hypothetical protein
LPLTTASFDSYRCHPLAALLVTQLSLMSACHIRKENGQQVIAKLTSRSEIVEREFAGSIWPNGRTEILAAIFEMQPQTRT